MKYLTSLAVGVLYLIATIIVFQFLARHSVILGYLSKSQQLNENSLVYVLVFAFDMLIYTLLSIFSLLAYRKAFKKQPFSWLTAVLIQLPLAGFILLNGINMTNTFSIYETGSIVAKVYACVVVLFVFFAMRGFHNSSEKLSYS